MDDSAEPRANPTVGPLTTLAGPNAAAEICAASGQDYALSQTFDFGAELQAAFPEFHYEPRIIVLPDSTPAFLPLMRLRRRPAWLTAYESMPLSLQGGPIVAGYAEADWVARALGQLRGNSIAIHGLREDVAARLPPSRIRTTHTHVLALDSGFEQIWSQRFERKTRSQCRVARKKGVVVHTARSSSDMDDYYRLYAASASRWGYAAPPHSRALFDALSRLFGRGVEVKIASVSGQAVAGVVLLHGRRSTLYWSGAFLKEHSTYCAPNALLEEAIREAIERGNAHFDFGSSGALAGVRQFKEGFGAQETKRFSYERADAIWHAASLLRRLLWAAPRSSRADTRVGGRAAEGGRP